MRCRDLIRSSGLLMVLGLAASGLALAAEGAPRRPGQVEYSIGLIYTDDESVQGRNGSSLDIGSRAGLQAGIDYYLSSRLALGFDMSWVEPNYRATLAPDDGSAPVSINRRASLFTGQFNATFNLLEGPFTPFAELGLGWTFFDSRVPSGPPVIGCWWDPFWGYICSDTYRTYNESNLSYGMGLGVRMDLNERMFAKATYRWLEIDLDGGRSKPMIESAAVELGWRF
jgi:opacity protein-like surface antigen